MLTDAASDQWGTPELLLGPEFALSRVHFISILSV